MDERNFHPNIVGLRVKFFMEKRSHILPQIFEVGYKNLRKIMRK